MSKIQDMTNHVNRVNEIAQKLCRMIKTSAAKHDASKFHRPEICHFTQVEYEPYGTDAYFDTLERLKPALDHHYMVNPHHPQHYENGVNGMNLIDVIEMFCDWLSMQDSSEEFEKSLKISQERFGIDEQLIDIFRNTERILKEQKSRSSVKPKDKQRTKCRSCK